MGSVILSNVSKVYPGGVRAVEDVSLTIPEGCFAALVGPSGCGKSTVLRMIAGLEDVTQGSVSIAGRVVNDIEPKDRDIAMVFQSYALYPHMTVEKNLGFALSMRGIPKPEITRRVHDVARALGIEELLQRRPGELSGGQRQRVAVGRAIVREPKVFLFDEPLSNLDAKLRVSTRAELKALHARLRTTTVFVTHDQEEAMTLGQLVVVMSRGKVQQAGTPQEVYDAPANRFVAGFVGTPPMNFIDAALQPAPAHDAVLARLPAGNHLPLHPGQSRALRDKASSACVLGIRPGALRLCPPDQALFAGSVTLADFLGDFVDVHLRTDAGLAILARVDVSQAQSAGLLGTGQAPTLRVGLTAPAERFHVFAPGPEGQRWA